MKNHLTNIQKVRLLRGYKQHYMAVKLGVTTQAYSQIERGIINLSTDKLLKIAEILSVSEAVLLNDAKVEEFLNHDISSLSKNYYSLKGELSLLREEIQRKDAIIAKLLAMLPEK